MGAGCGDEGSEGDTAVQPSRSAVLAGPMSEACHTAAMRRLFPLSSPPASPPPSAHDGGNSAPVPVPPDVVDREWTLEELADAYAYPAADEPVRAGRTGWLRANMVSSVDGAAHHDGRSQPLSGAADMRIFGVLRGLADAVVVGAETVRQEGYRPARARAAFAARREAAGQGPAPAIAVVSAGLGAGLLAAAVHRAAGADPRADRRGRTVGPGASGPGRGHRGALRRGGHRRRPVAGGRGAGRTGTRPAAHRGRAEAPGAVRGGRRAGRAVPFAGSGGHGGRRGRGS